MRMLAPPRRPVLQVQLFMGSSFTALVFYLVCTSLVCAHELRYSIGSLSAFVRCISCKIMLKVLLVAEFGVVYGPAPRPKVVS